ncbi:MAG: hypothetical protein WB347_24860 [Terriglobales bacterium]
MPPPNKLERVAVVLPNLESMKAEFNPLRPKPALVNAELPFPIRELVEVEVPSRALAGVEARDGETTEALPRGFVAAAVAL